MRPSEVKTVTVLTSLNAFRLVGFVFAAQALSGDLPRSEVFGGIGDGIAGLTAVPIAIALWKRPTYHVWVAAIIWNVYALTDACFANAISTWAPDAQPQPIGGYVIPLFFVATHVINLKLLVSPPVRDHYMSNTASNPLS
jgi:hypothetical protein